MSIFKRIAMLFGAKANKALDKAENPNETLDYSYQKQLELLQKVRRGVADVATSRKRLELQIGQLEQQQAIELLISKLRETRSNTEFLMQVKAQTPTTGAARTPAKD